MKEKTRQETEQSIQSRKIKQLEAEGYYVIKLIRTNRNGIPDLIAIPKNSDALFIEVKRPGKKRTPLQEFRGKELTCHGVEVQVYTGQ
jgi:hypothetical protein